MRLMGVKKKGWIKGRERILDQNLCIALTLATDNIVLVSL